MSFRRTNAFTLIELLVVISIIGLLAGIFMGASGYAHRNAIESRIRAEIKAMETALEAYKADNGSYPPSDPEVLAAASGSTNFVSGSTGGAWTNNAWIYNALSPTNGGKIYMKFSKEQLSNRFPGGMTLIVDPLGKPYGYNPFKPVANPQTFDLFSCGLDKVTSYPKINSQNDDIGNWQK